MSRPVISVEGLGKQYRLGQVGLGTLRADIDRWWHRVRGKEDPYLKLGEANDRSKKGNSELVWALRDVNFDVNAGEVLGIIGKNGAGKSTLLKILSKVTSPTTGSVKIKGRIASLLEVGTGFHPDLSGRENIFLNGAILGMNKQEIRSKFDEIVSFSGVERYIDTPVKRYSSGMYVRLAFAVAAHLDPEILIVDEVLAVGDAEFQKKCLGKMKDVSGQGRTVLFVSHNLPAVRTLCTRGLYLTNGTVNYFGGISECLDQYGRTRSSLNTYKLYDEPQGRPSTEIVELIEYKLCNQTGATAEYFNLYEKISIEIRYRIKKGGQNCYANLHFFDKDENYFFVESVAPENAPDKPGEYITRFHIERGTFNVGIYSVGIAFTVYPGTNVQFYLNPAMVFEVIEEDLSLRKFPYTGELPGVTRIQLSHITEKIKE